jgi:shikimate dehydrogenase
MKFGIIGDSLSHSFSKAYFEQKFKDLKMPHCSYHNYEISSLDEFPELIKANRDLRGLNVTSPYKEDIIHFLDEVDDMAEEIGAVNTIKVINAHTTGYNTDAFGFQKAIKPLLEDHHEAALILGTGGAAEACGYVLDKLGIDYSFVSRNPDGGKTIGYEDVTDDLLSETFLIVNATPLGRLQAAETFPSIPYESLTEDHLLFDLVYNPSETLFLKKGREAGAKTENGLNMLHIQAEKSWEIWMG